MKMTPMLEQYLRAKQEHPEALLFFRLGDFYELFFEDAERAAGVLDITLTTRSKKDEVPIPMCGVPYHSVQPYVAKLLGAGFKVALCDQMEDADAAKGLVSRSVVRVVTPGTVTEEEYLDPKQPNYLVAVSSSDDRIGVVSVDLSTGELQEFTLATEAALLDTLTRLGPREVLLDPAAETLKHVVQRALPAVMLSAVPAEHFDATVATEWLQEVAPDRVPQEAPAVREPLGAALWYLRETHRASLAHVRPPPVEDTAGVMLIDEATRRNLELLVTTRGERRGSLLAVIDETRTPMGGADVTTVASRTAHRYRRDRPAARCGRRSAAAPITARGVDAATQCDRRPRAADGPSARSTCHATRRARLGSNPGGGQAGPRSARRHAERGAHGVRRFTG